jgi:hypothetical protein
MSTIVDPEIGTTVDDDVSNTDADDFNTRVIGILAAVLLV